MKRIYGGVGVCLLILVPVVFGQAQQGRAKKDSTGVAAEPEAPGKVNPGPVAAEMSVLRLIKFSGQLHGAEASGGQARSGMAGLTFALYAAQEGGAALWLETQNVEADAEGRYSVLLGAESSEGLPLEIFSSGQARWLGVQVEGEEEQPRVLLVSVPYALKSADAERLGGQLAASFVSKDPETGQLLAGGEVLEPAALAAGGDGETAALTVDPGNVGNIVKYTGSPDTLGPATNFVETGGNVGIGTTNPQFLLDLVGSSIFSLGLSSSHPQGTLFQLGNTNTATKWNFAMGAGAGFPAGQFIIDEHGVGPRFVIDPGGNVGIGTTNPQFLLDLVGSSIFSLGLSSSHPQGTLFQLGNTNTATKWNIAMGAGAGFPAGQFIIDEHGVGPRFVIDPGGNVGIGTSSPTAKLEVAGQVKIGTTTFTADGKVGIGTATPTQKLELAGGVNNTVIIGGPGIPSFSVFSSDPGGRDWRYESGRSAAGQLDITDCTIPNVGCAPRMTFTTDGNVGIGTSSPTAKLEVAGQVKITGGSPGADKVLTSDAVGLGSWKDGTTCTGPCSFSGSNSTQILEVTQNGPGILNPSIDNLPPAAILARATAGSNFVAGVIGIVSNPNSIGVLGVNTATGGEFQDANGIAGITRSSKGVGVVGEAESSTGETIGVRGVVNSSAGVAGVFRNDGGGRILEGQAPTGAPGDGVRFRVESDGNVFADGSYNCGLAENCFNTGIGADIAERIDTSEELAPGDMVAVDPDNPGRFRKARGPYDPYLAGIISTAPAVTMANNDLEDNDTNERTDTRPLLALAGRVPVKVTAEGGPIQPGDPLTSSSRPGYAMKATRTGRVVGMALGEFSGQGEGEVEVFLNSHTWVNPDDYEETQRMLSAIRAELEDAKQVLAQVANEVRALRAQK